jgi:hypothetical protein
VFMQFIDIQTKSFLVSLSSHHCCTWFSFFCLAIMSGVNLLV